MQGDIRNGCLVTGATGFIGSHLIAAFRQRDGKIAALTRGRHAQLFARDVSPRIADLACPSSLSGVCQDVDTVIHLAGYAHTEDANSVHSAAIHQQITVEGTRALLAEATRAGVKRFVFASSVKAMGEGGPDCLDESSTAQPGSTYGRAKLDAEQLILEAGKHGMHTSIVRFPVVYGHGNKGNITRMIRAIDRRYFPPFPKVDNRRSMVHVADAVQALLLASDQSEANGQVYIATDGQAYSTREIYEAICHALVRPIPRWSIPMSLLKLGALAGDAIEWMSGRPMPLNRCILSKLLGSAWYSSDKISRELGFRPQHTLYEALPEMIAEYRRGTSAS